MHSHALLIAIVAVSILLMLVRPKNIPEVWIGSVPARCCSWSWG